MPFFGDAAARNHCSVDDILCPTGKDVPGTRVADHPPAVWATIWFLKEDRLSQHFLFHGSHLSGASRILVFAQITGELF